MSFIVILASLAIQWFLNFNSAQYEFHWANKYSQWMMNRKLSVIEKGHGFFTVLFLVLPAVIMVSLIFTIVYHVLGHIGYLILSLLLLCYLSLFCRYLKHFGMNFFGIFGLHLII